MPTIEHLLAWLWQTTWQSLVLAIVIAIVTWTLRRRLSPQATQLLWMIVFVRLVMPAVPGSPLSLYGLLESAPAIREPIARTRVVLVEQADDWLYTTNKSMAANCPPEKTANRLGLSLILIWETGTVAFIGWIALSTIRFSRRLSRYAKAADAETRQLVDECCRELRVRRPRVMSTDLVSTPAVFGAIRPQLLLPAAAALRIDSADLRSVILHELEHVRRHHLLVEWLLIAIRAVHWFNPAAWYAQARIRAARELVCDQAVLSRLDEPASRRYGLAMLELATGTLTSPRAVPLAAFASGNRLLRQRIEAIVTRKSTYIAGLGIVLAIAITAVFLTRPINPTPAKSVAATQGTTHPFNYVDADWTATGDIPPPLIDDYNRHADTRNLVIENLQFDAVPLKEAFRRLAEQAKTKIQVDWDELRAVGIEEAFPISGSFHHARLAAVLEGMFKSVNNDKAKLDYFSYDKGVSITTANALRHMPMTRVYDIRNLIMAKSVEDRATRVAKVIDWIRATVDPDSWNRAKDPAKIREIGGQLIVTATNESQLTIQYMLEDASNRTWKQAVLEFRVVEMNAELSNQILRTLNQTKTGPAEMNDAQAHQMLAHLAEKKDVKFVTAPRITAITGQTVDMSVGGGKTPDITLRAKPIINEQHTAADLTFATEQIAQRGEEKPPTMIDVWTSPQTDVTISNESTLIVPLTAMTYDLAPDGTRTPAKAGDVTDRQRWMMIKSTLIIP